MIINVINEDFETGSLIMLSLSLIIINKVLLIILLNFNVELGTNSVWNIAKTSLPVTSELKAGLMKASPRKTHVFR